MVQLLGDSPRLRAPAGSEPESPPPAPATPPVPEAQPGPAQPETPPAASALTDAMPLGPKAEAKPPKITRRQKPPPVKPPEVEAETPPQPKRAPPPQREARTRPKPPEPAKPRNVYDMLNRTLGRDTIAQTLGTAQGRPNPDIQRYLQRVMAKIQANWVSPSPNISSRLVVGYSFTVNANGQVSNIRLTRASGDAAFDRSVGQALRNASPLPPLHPAFGSRYTFNLGFNPEQIRRR